MTVARAVLALLAAGSGTLAAQVPELPTLGADWTEVSYPKLFWTGRDGFFVGLYYSQIRPMGFDDYDDPERYRASLSVDGHLTSTGRKDLKVDARFPKTVRGWRFQAGLTAFRHPRDYYFGVGNDARYSADSIRPGQEFYFDADRYMTRIRGEIQREIVRHVRLLAGVHVESRRLDLPRGASRLDEDATSGRITTVGRRVGDATFRVGAVLDTRNDEVAPRRGVRAELIYAIADSALLGDFTYTRTTASAAGYVSLGSSAVGAARVVVQHMGGAPDVGSYFLIEASDDPYEGLGGEDAHRALQDGRFLGRHKLLGNFDLRYDLLRVATLLEAQLLLFVDAGRVFETEPLALTTDGMHVGGGAGLFVRWGRTGVFGSTWGVGPDGLVWQVSTRWAY